MISSLFVAVRLATTIWMMLLPPWAMALMLGSRVKAYFTASRLPLPAAASAKVNPSVALISGLAPASISAFMAGTEPARAAISSGAVAATGGGIRYSAASKGFFLGAALPPAAATCACGGGGAGVASAGGGGGGGGVVIALGLPPLDKTSLTKSGFPLAAAIWISCRPSASRAFTSAPREITCMAKGTLSSSSAPVITVVPSGRTALVLAPASSKAMEADGTLLCRAKKSGVNPFLVAAFTLAPFFTK